MTKLQKLRGESEEVFVSDDRLSKSDLNCFLCRVCDLRTGGKNFLQDNLSNFLNIFPSVKTQEKRKYIYVNNTFCV